jgi:hypothetical protein
MNKINTSNIDKTPFVSEYTRKFGKGTEGKNNMAFAMLKYVLIGIFGIIGLAAIGGFCSHIFWGINFWDIFWSAKPVEALFTVLCSALMLILGYLFKGTSE